MYQAFSHFSGRFKDHICSQENGAGAGLGTRLVSSTISIPHNDIIIVIVASMVISSCTHVLVMNIFNQNKLIFSNCATILLSGESLAAILL